MYRKVHFIINGPFKRFQGFHKTFPDVPPWIQFQKEDIGFLLHDVGIRVEILDYQVECDSIEGWGEEVTLACPGEDTESLLQDSGWTPLNQ